MRYEIICEMRSVIGCGGGVGGYAPRDLDRLSSVPEIVVWLQETRDLMQYGSMRYEIVYCMSKQLNYQVQPTMVQIGLR
jgi:hypothetical protein